ncbi:MULTISPECIES: non-hydrolyzing UDP-N-acetylglucosamine 2-epimerase [unclassified Acidovorax]|uniref:non-hydrolyzing UDP-N-acetylglucosamine 2-epimerase n=1 Tax=unclassified Acidovorax TaxID=2684926 RepID=UPI0006FC62A4|nr:MULTISPECIES: UDP-N-acetylglucosamine 2-epimerase (non-hydrolyzing) [unclassified Acidovorax]KQW24495.1 UDP-N-acetyl glucosamine 2-epimerase [Acidovorax sp. Root402]MCT6719096.1 UDP-N-acetylglucosamine 2-epimerase (non-hydrolyzing) [Acidovorax sp. K2F]|eukprot:gene8755-8846_t
MTTYLACLGTRPEIIKMAPLHRELKLRGHRVVVLHTGQHAEVAEVLYRFFDMGPDLRLALERRTPRLGDLTALLLEGVDRLVDETQPDVVLVQGDTTSALVGALSGYYNDKPVAHIEAGLRTGTREPFPEEKNRELIARLAHWHFAPTARTRDNLLREGIADACISVVGNTVIDAARWTQERLQTNASSAPSVLPSGSSSVVPAMVAEFLDQQINQRLLLVTAHRRENWGDPIRNIATAIGQLLAAHGDLVVVWPLHPNPAVSQAVRPVIDALPDDLRQRVCLTEPMDYPALISLLQRCYFTLTDSGGIQEEASALRRPVLIARDSTERQELVEAGGAVLVGTDIRRMVTEAARLLRDDGAYRSMQLESSPFGDGHTAQHIADRLCTVD